MRKELGLFTATPQIFQNDESSIRILNFHREISLIDKQYSNVYFIIFTYERQRQDVNVPGIINKYIVFKENMPSV